MIQSLNGQWHLFNSDHPEKYNLLADIPGSVYSALIKEMLIENPYYRENEYKSTQICEDGCTYAHGFSLDESIKAADRILLRFNGIDTVSEIALNGTVIGSTDNMHRVYTFDVTDIIKDSDNELVVKIASPIKYITEKNEQCKLWGVSSTMSGYPHIRKAHYMFGWDWGPVLPDMGIWRNVELIGVQGALIDSVFVRQNHADAENKNIGLDLDITLSNIVSTQLAVDIEITAPDGRIFTQSADMNETRKKTVHIDIDNAELWYPRGYGSQPLYTLKATLYENGSQAASDVYQTQIGLRTITVSREKDAEGEEFAFVVNNIKIFAMGANYIPENQIISKCSRAKTEKLLKQCCLANFNMIRVWGGGYYPEDYFYEACDKMGLLVWQDFMFACSVYKADVDFCETVKREISDNVKRLRNHASLAMWCGNNEIESMWQYWGIDSSPEFKKDYLRLFEVLIPKVLDFYDPITYYHPSSPSTHGGFIDSGNNNMGDSHYWDVWHGLKPFTEYNKYKFRFCSEFGFESIPSIKTVRTFAEDDDLNLMSPVMEAHQKCEAGSEKIMYYLAQMSHYPYNFKSLIYATQMVQADAVRLNVEHMRRNRGICMGSLYWQVNDSNPVISWSSIDCCHRWKALHYRAKHFYAPVLISADCSDSDNIRLNVSSERQDEFSAIIRWRSRKNTGEIIMQGFEEIIVKPLSAEDFVTITPEQSGISKAMRDKAYIEFAVIEKGVKLSSNTCMLVPPKKFRFKNPKIKFIVTDIGNKFKIEITSDAFAKGVFLDLIDGDCLFSDNFFDMHSASVNVYVSKANLPSGITADDFSANLSIQSYFEVLDLTE